MNTQKFNEYKGRLCRIIFEKTWKHRCTYPCVFGIVEIVNDQLVSVTDNKESWFEIPIEAIRGIHVNEEQW
jgi:hypothetical protein